jgi:hypothetical protein
MKLQTVFIPSKEMENDLQLVNLKIEKYVEKSSID